MTIITLYKCNLCMTDVDANVGSPGVISGWGVYSVAGEELVFRHIEEASSHLCFTCAKRVNEEFRSRCSEKSFS